MSVSYKREMNHNYMIITSTIQEAEGYECKMLSSNTIEGLLKFRVGHFEEKEEFYYEITSKQPLDRILNQRTITGNEIRGLLLSIAATLGKIENFLLKEERIMLEPEYIYVDPDHFNVYLCMVPGYFCDFPAAVSTLLAYLIGKVNHQDKEGVVLAYDLYHESLKENYGLSDLLGHFSGRGKTIFDMRQPELKGEQSPSHAGSGEYGGAGEHARPGEYARAGEFTESGEYKTSVENKASVENKESGEFASLKEVRPDSLKVPASRKNSGFLVKGIKTIFLVIVAEAILWVFTGLSGFVRYGIFVGGAIPLMMCVPATIKSGRKNKTVNPNIEQKETWQLIPQEKTDKDWTDWIESDSIGECEKINLTKEPETALLMAKSETSHFALLESLSRERENITISYVPFVIGKHSDMADYCLRQPTVSRLHLRIDQKEGVYIVTDLNSTNGTIVEGYHLQANETVSIKSGDTIYMADAGYRFLNN